MTTRKYRLTQQTVNEADANRTERAIQKERIERNIQPTNEPVSEPTATAADSATIANNSNIDNDDSQEERNVKIYAEQQYSKRERKK